MSPGPSVLSLIVSRRRGAQLDRTTISCGVVRQRVVVELTFPLSMSIAPPSPLDPALPPEIVTPENGRVPVDGEDPRVAVTRPSIVVVLAAAPLIVIALST